MADSKDTERICITITDPEAIAIIKRLKSGITKKFVAETGIKELFKNKEFSSLMFQSEKEYTEKEHNDALMVADNPIRKRKEKKEDIQDLQAKEQKNNDTKPSGAKEDVLKFTSF